MVLLRSPNSANLNHLINGLTLEDAVSSLKAPPAPMLSHPG